MAKYRDAVYEADKGGDQAQIEQALRDLRGYVFSHMNTSLASGNNGVYPPIQLQHTYERAQAEQQKQLGTINANLYHDAQQKCQEENAGADGSAIIACIERHASESGVQLGTVPDAIYKFDFVSAKWSPDLAGWSIVITLVSAVIFAVTAVRRWLKHN